MNADVVIIGAGVSGLFAAYQLIKQGFKGTITIVEQGLSMRERLALRKTSSSTLRGVGGPGFFTAGKICLSEKAGTRLPGFIEDLTLKRYVDFTLDIIRELLPEVKVIPSLPNEKALTIQKSKLQTVGLEMSLSYPVVDLGTDQVRQLALSFEKYLTDHNVNLLTGVTAQQIKILSYDTIEITLRERANDKLIHCQYLINAVGRSGHDWLCKQLEQHLNIKLAPNIPDIGIRLEFPRAVTEELLRAVLNPRIVMQWNDTSIKTHCWCDGGHISTYDYLDSSIVDGEFFKSSSTSYTSVNLLYHFANRLAQDPVKKARMLLQEISRFSQGFPLKQSLGALKGDQQLYHPLIGSAPSEDFKDAQLECFFPEEILKGFIEFIQRMDMIWPGIADSSTLIYAPVLEWDTYSFPVDKHMRLLRDGYASDPIQNIYAVGDGAGLSQGIVTAGTTGLIAAEHLLQSYSNAYPTKQNEAECREYLSIDKTPETVGIA